MTTEITVEQEPAVVPAGAVTDEQLISMLVERARGEGSKLTGEGGLLQQLTKRALEFALDVRVPQNVAGTFEPQVARKRQRRLSGADDLVLSLSAKGLTHGEIAAHLAQVYCTEVSKQTIFTTTEPSDDRRCCQGRGLPCSREC